MTSNFSILLRCTLLVLFLLLNSCQLPEITYKQTSNKMEVSTNVESLGKYVNWPSPPIKVFWQTREITKPSLLPGPIDRSLIAVLTFDDRTLDKIIQKSVRSQQMNRPYIQDQLVFDWFPAELKKSLTPSETPGFFRINQDGYEPDIFVKSPFLQGYFVRVGKTSDLFIYLHTQ